ncbi:unnamed protein product [Schistosoma margrebowiei]|uniref:Uncharacterized protein n=1 Tax=Schistosoma margrebowiei TaxID=48269 RepID=A0A3P8FVS5_9TREM|nr:unnamed protein product [Schistosoma margrebowiei]
MTRIPFYLGLVSWMHLHPRVVVHSGTRTQYRSLQTPSRYPLSFRVMIATCLCNVMQVHLADESQIERNARQTGFQC